MSTIKSFTSLEQSRKLAEILPLESADMYYWCADSYPKEDWIIEVGTPDNNYECICVWSLAALLGVLPILNDRSPVLSKTFDRKYRVVYHSTAYETAIITSDYNNPVDACVEMILKLHELKML